MLPLQSDNHQHRFSVWAPEKATMILHIVAPFERDIPMQKNGEGYFTADVETPHKELTYFFRPEGDKDVPDPASHYQPQGVHGPSQTVDHSGFSWTDNGWKGLPLAELVIYELHVGLFTPEGSFDAIIPRLDDLKATGINALEIMPVAQFPGDRNWGYDGVFPYAVQDSYGGPYGLKRLVDACHRNGMAVVLDVVYNHLGPEGNYFPRFGPYFTSKYSTPWGDAINLDGEWSDGVRDYFSGNAVYWMEHFHIDGLRCDAIHAMFDSGAVHFWELTGQKIKQLEEKTGRSYFLIAESDLNSPKVVKTPEQGGYGFDAQWLDDFHHSLYALINPSDQRRYYDFGSIRQLAKAYNDGFVHSGEWVSYRKRRYGASSAHLPGDKFVVFTQNHDQVGNRPDGKRLGSLVGPERVQLAAAATLLSPYLPMLFMGEEYSEEAPFLYFVSHSDKELIRAVREGRKNEFKDFGFDESVPDPEDPANFLRCKLAWEKRDTGHHRLVLQWYTELIRLRKTLPALGNMQKKHIRAEPIDDQSLVLFRHTADMENGVLSLFNFSEKAVNYRPLPNMEAAKLLDSRESRWSTGKTGLVPAHPMRISATRELTLQPLSVVLYAF